MDGNITGNGRKSVPGILTGAAVWDGLSERPRDGMEVLIMDGRIAEMGSSVSRPGGAQVIDLSGHTITPGFMDCHVHITLDPANPFGSITNYSGVTKGLFALAPLQTLLMNGFTTIRDAGAFDHGFVTVDLKNAIEKGLIAGPRMFVAPHMVSPTGGHSDLAGIMATEFAPALRVRNIADGPDEIRRVVREEIRGGADWIKFAASGGFGDPYADPSQPTYSQEEMNVLVQAAHDLNVPVCAHVYGNEGVRRAVAAGADSVEHGSLAAPADLALMEERGIYLLPTLSTFPDFDRLSDPAYAATMPGFMGEKFRRYADDLQETRKRIAASRVKIVFGTDAGTFPFADVPGEFPAMVKMGLSPLRALKAATSMAAEMLKRPDLGVLAVGKTADIIAMPGDPFADISVTGRVDLVMKEGVVYREPGE